MIKIKKQEEIYFFKSKDINLGSSFKRRKDTHIGKSLNLNEATVWIIKKNEKEV